MAPRRSPLVEQVAQLFRQIKNEVDVHRIGIVQEVSRRIEQHIALAFDLARRGVRVLVLERSASPRRLPKMERCNARTMEMFRRLGLAPTIRGASRFTPMPMDVFVMADFKFPPLLHLRYPSVPQEQARIAACRDAACPLEPAQLISQYTLEPILRRAADEAGAMLVYGMGVESFVQDAGGVTVVAARADGVRRWRAAIGPEIREATPAGEAMCANVAALAAEGQPLGHEMLGIELGYRYTQSPVIATEAAALDSTIREYHPTATPGARLPHLCAQAGAAVHDQLGRSFTLLNVGHETVEASAFMAAMRKLGAPLEIVHLPEERLHEAYENSLLLVRPDLHVAWRGDALPGDAYTLAALVTGHIIPPAASPS